MTGLSAVWMMSGVMTIPGWDGGSRTEEDLLALYPSSLSISTPFYAVIACTSLGFYNLPPSLLFPLRLPSCLLGLSLAQWNLFLQEKYCLALGEEELAELRLFCAQRRREALGQGVAHLVPPKFKECTCEKVCSTPAPIFPFLHSLPSQYCRRS